MIGSLVKAEARPTKDGYEFISTISLSMNSCKDRDQATKIAEIQTRTSPKPRLSITPVSR